MNKVLQAVLILNQMQKTGASADWGTPGPANDWTKLMAQREKTQSPPRKVVAPVKR